MYTIQKNSGYDGKLGGTKSIMVEPVRENFRNLVTF